jgi:hypothetical protein
MMHFFTGFFKEVGFGWVDFGLVLFIITPSKGWIENRELAPIFI